MIIVPTSLSSQKTRYPNQLRVLIEQAGLTFRDVADQTQIPDHALFDWAQGKQVIPQMNREQIAAVIGCQAQALEPLYTCIGKMSALKQQALAYRFGVAIPTYDRASIPDRLPYRQVIDRMFRALIHLISSSLSASHKQATRKN
jgi:hypothetical protein